MEFILMNPISWINRMVAIPAVKKHERFRRFQVFGIETYTEETIELAIMSVLHTSFPIVSLSSMECRHS